MVEEDKAEPALVDLCDRRGELAREAHGWSPTPRFRANLAGHHRGRRKRWDYWCVTFPEGAVSFLAFDLDYLAVVGASFIDFARGTLDERAALVLPASLPLADRAGQARLSFERGGLRLSMIDRPGGTELEASFGKGSRRREASVWVAMPEGHDTLSMVVPWGKQRFQLNVKHVARPADGTVRLASGGVRLGQGAFGTLDFGRGVWPHVTHWNWSATSFRAGGRTVGVNLGGGWTAGTGMTENGLVVGGRASKLHHELSWQVGGRDARSPWRITDPLHGRVAIEVEPVFPVDKGLWLGLIGARLRQVFGRFSGQVVTDDGERIELPRSIGWAEDFSARW